LVPEHVEGGRRVAVVAALQRHANPQLLEKPLATYNAKTVILHRDAKGFVRCPHCLMGGFAHKGAVSNHIKQCTGCEEVCAAPSLYLVPTSSSSHAADCPRACIHVPYSARSRSANARLRPITPRLAPTSSTSTVSCLRPPRLRSRGRLCWLASSHIFSTFVDSQCGRSRARRSSRPHSG